MKKLHYYFGILLFLISIFSCQKEEQIINLNEPVVSDIYEPNLGEMTVLGDKLEDPYALSNMQKAYDSLVTQGRLKSNEVDLKATHIYVRFLPEDIVELDSLFNDDALILFDYPLDYEVKEMGNYFHDPEIPSDKPTWLYTVVPLDYQFPNIKYEKIYECFFPDKDAKENSLKSTDQTEIYSLLEEEAYRITGNLDTEDISNQNVNLKGTTASWHYPSGQIRVWNTELGANGGTEGVMHVKVRTQRLTNLGDAWTDDNGYYNITNAHYKYDCNYSVKFENEAGFKIWGEFVFFTTVKYAIGKHSPRGYDKDIWKAYDAWKFASVNNAAYKYLNYCDQYSISKPPSDLRIWVLKTSGGRQGSASMLRRTWGYIGFNTNDNVNDFFNNAIGLNLGLTITANLTSFLQPDLTISINNDYDNTDDVFGLVFHECGHASHWTEVGSSYWVKYINHIITYGAYGDGSEDNAGYCGVGEMWGNYYSAFLERDHFNYTTPFTMPWPWFDEDEDWFNPGFLREVDAISDVTTSEIFSCLTSSTTSIDKLVTTLKTKTEYGTQIDDAYNNPDYEDWP